MERDEVVREMARAFAADMIGEEIRYLPPIIAAVEAALARAEELGWRLVRIVEREREPFTLDDAEDGK